MSQGVERVLPYPERLRQAWLAHLAPRQPEAPTVVSTFAGCGGSSLGYSIAGFRELLAVEWEDNAVETFRLNFPEVPIYHGDIGELTVEACLESIGIASGELDILDGSPPCQGFSTAGTRKLGDERNQLFREFVRLARGLRPKVLVMENVSGMVKGKMRLIFAEVLSELRDAGYVVSARLMATHYFGVPQARQRMIFIGVRTDIHEEYGIEPSHPRGRERPISAETSLKDVEIDQEELEMLRDVGARAAAYKEWHLIPAGRTRTDVLKGNGFSCRKYHPKRPAFTVTKSDSHMHLHGAMHWSERRRFTVAEFKQ